MPDSHGSDPSSEFLGHMLRNQRSIRNDIFSLHPLAQDLDDLLQQTALTRSLAPRMPDLGNFVFNRRLAGLPASAYVAEVSPTLQPGSWSPLTLFSSAPHPQLPGFDQVTVQVPPAPRNFVRLRVGGAP